ncbi:MAG: D-alanine--D-alanine ligase [Candidatus Omnitrophota bacterium]
MRNLSGKTRKKKIKPGAGFGRIGVLMGGPSTERRISLKSGTAVYECLKAKGLDVVAINIKTDKVVDNARLIRRHNIDCAFIALHGRFGEDGKMQRILDLLGIPYTGSGVLASSLAIDKVASRKIFQQHGLMVPGYKVLEKKRYGLKKGVRTCFSLPVVVKPATHGSSIGLTLVNDNKGLPAAIKEAFSFDERIIIEEYIGGREVTVGILAQEALPAIEIIPKSKFFDYVAKYHPGMTEYIVPAKVDKHSARAIRHAALKAHKSLGCFGCSRVDMILDNKGNVFVLEVNTIPGFTSTSLLPKAAQAKGIDFFALCLKLLQLAYEKK